MNAEEMFERLGYKKFTTITGYIIYTKYEETDDDDEDEEIIYSPKNIAFFLDEKFVHFGYIDVTMEEFEAIQQQLKELGWLEEETCTNESEYNLVDGFECSNCGIIIENYNEIEIDEDYPEDRCMKEYAPRYCPNCGRKIVD